MNNEAFIKGNKDGGKMYVERIFKTIKESFLVPSFSDIADDGFYKPESYDLDEEYRRYRQMLTKGEEDKAILFRIGRINHYRGNIDEAVKLYNKALEIDENYGEVHYILGNIFFQQNELKKSKLHYEKALKESPGDVYALNGLAKSYMGLKEFEEAEKYHKTALILNPQDLYAMRGLGNIYLLQQNFGEALNYYYKALEINPSDKITLFNIGLIYLLSRKFENAEKHYKENAKKHRFYGFYTGLGLLFYKHGKKIEAYEFYKKAVQMERTYELDMLFNMRLDEPEWNIIVSTDHFCKAKAFYSLNKQNEAIKELEITVSINPQFSEAHNLLGKLYFEKGNFSSALKHYELSLILDDGNMNVLKEACRLRLTLNPKDLESLKKLQHIYWLEEDFDREIEILKKITRISGEPVGFYRLGCTFLAKGEKEKGEDTFNKMLALEEEEDLAYLGFAKLYSARSDYNIALEYIEKALDIEKNSEYYIQAGNIHEKMGNSKKALLSYHKAVTLSPYSRMAHRHYVDCLLEIYEDKKAEEIVLKKKSLGATLSFWLYFI